MTIYDGRGRVLRPTDDGLWFDATFLYYPPLARVLALPTLELVEPLRVQRACGETPEEGDRELARLRWRYGEVRAAVGSGRREESL